MRRSVVTLLLLLEPLHFGFEASRVLSTIAYRGMVAAIELGAHAVVAVACAGAAFVFWNGGPDARRFVTIAAVASVTRTIQSVYWSVLPDDTRPGDELIVALTALTIGTLTLVLVWVSGSVSGFRLPASAGAGRADPALSTAPRVEHPHRSTEHSTQH